MPHSCKLRGAASPLLPFSQLVASGVFLCLVESQAAEPKGSLMRLWRGEPYQLFHDGRYCTHGSAIHRAAQRGWVLSRPQRFLSRENAQRNGGGVLERGRITRMLTHHAQSQHQGGEELR